MGLASGRLDRRITIEKEVRAQNAIGEVQISYSTFAQVPANVKPMTASERYRSDSVRSSKVSKFTIRYLPGVLPTMRILFDGEYYRITGIAEVERRVGLELTAESFK